MVSCVVVFKKQNNEIFRQNVYRFLPLFHSKGFRCTVHHRTCIEIERVHKKGSKRNRSSRIQSRIVCKRVECISTRTPYKHASPWFDCTHTHSTERYCSTRKLPKEINMNIMEMEDSKREREKAKQFSTTKSNAPWERIDDSQYIFSLSVLCIEKDTVSGNSLLLSHWSWAESAEKKTNSLFFCLLFATIIPTTYYCHYVTSNVFVGVQRICMHVTEIGRSGRRRGKRPIDWMSMRAGYCDLTTDHHNINVVANALLPADETVNNFENAPKKWCTLQEDTERNQSLHIKMHVYRRRGTFIYSFYSIFLPLYFHLRSWACEKKVVRMERTTLPFSNGKNSNKQSKITYIELS